MSLILAWIRHPRHEYGYERGAPHHEYAYPGSGVLHGHTPARGGGGKYFTTIYLDYLQEGTLFNTKLAQ